MGIKYSSKRHSGKSFDDLQLIPEDVVRREMDKQKEAKEKTFHDRETLDKEIAEVRESFSVALHDLLKSDECRFNVLNERIKKLRDQRDLSKKPEISEVPRKKQIPPYGFSRIPQDVPGCFNFILSNPWDFEYRYAFTHGNPVIDTIADKNSGLMQVFSSNNIGAFNDASIAIVGSMLGSSFDPSPQDGQLWLWGDPWYTYNWNVYSSWILMAEATAFVGIQVDRYTRDNVFDQTVVNNTTQLWDYTAYSFADARNYPNDPNGFDTDSDAYFTASLDVDSDHRYVVWLKFEIVTQNDGSSPVFLLYAGADAAVTCTFPWILGAFCPSD